MKCYICNEKPVDPIKKYNLQDSPVRCMKCRVIGAPSVILKGSGFTVGSMYGNKNTMNEIDKDTGEKIYRWPNKDIK